MLNSPCDSVDGNSPTRERDGINFGELYGTFYGEAQSLGLTNSQINFVWNSSLNNCRPTLEQIIWYGRETNYSFDLSQPGAFNVLLGSNISRGDIDRVFQLIRQGELPTFANQFGLDPTRFSSDTSIPIEIDAQAALWWFSDEGDSLIADIETTKEGLTQTPFEIPEDIWWVSLEEFHTSFNSFFEEYDSLFSRFLLLLAQLLDFILILIAVAVLFLVLNAMGLSVFIAQELQRIIGTVHQTLNDIYQRAGENILYSDDSSDETSDPNVDEEKVGRVIDESENATGGITSGETLNEDEALKALEDWVGDDYEEVAPGVFRSRVPNADGTYNQGRMDDSSLEGAHAPNVPHVHLQRVRPLPYYGGEQRWGEVSNNHVPFTPS